MMPRTFGERRPFIVWFIRCVFHVILFSTLASLMSACIPVALGVCNGLIPNDAMRASSVLDRYHVPSQARLNNTKQGKSGGAWKPKVNDKKQYLEVDIGALTNVSQVGVCCCGAVLTCKCLDQLTEISFDKKLDISITPAM